MNAQSSCSPLGARRVHNENRGLLLSQAVNHRAAV